VWQWQVQETSLIKERLRQHWQTFLKVAIEELPAMALPKWEKTTAADVDDEIPF
jgi:hypothetical protein